MSNKKIEEKTRPTMSNKKIKAWTESATKGATELATWEAIIDTDLQEIARATWGATRGATEEAAWEATRRATCEATAGAAREASKNEQ